MPDEAGDGVELEEPMMDFAGIGKTVDGTGFAYRTMACVSKGVSSIRTIESYVHLQSVDLSNNAIEDVSPLRGLNFLLRLNLSQNAVESIGCWGCDDPFPYLVHLDMSGNSLPSLPALPMKALKTASFARNRIACCDDFTGHGRLQVLDLSEQRGGKIESLSGIGSLPALTRLNVSSNQLRDFDGLHDVPMLAHINASTNLFEELHGPWEELPEAEALDLSNCRIAAPEALEALQMLPRLRSLEVRENPFCEPLEGSLRVEALIRRPGLQSIDGEPVTEEEAEEASSTAKQREEEARLKAEEEAAAAAAAAGEGGEDQG